MSDIEILLQVDAGHVPEGVSAVFMDEEDSIGRWVSLAIALAPAGGAVACMARAVNPAAAMLLLLTAGLIALKAVPTLPDPANPTVKRQVAVMTRDALMIRDGQGLRQWQLSELTYVVAHVYNRQSLLMLVDCRGREHALPPLHCRRGEKLRRLITQRLRIHPRSL
jgi:hypothetical protein